jgi:hypothetical protein
LKPHIIHSIPSDGYTCNINYSKKSKMARVQRASRRLYDNAWTKRARVQTP